MSYPGMPHVNVITEGPCHYYWGRNNHRLLFRENEIKYVEPTGFGAIVVLHEGKAEYLVTSMKPEQIVNHG